MQLPPKELAHLLSMSGSEVAAVEEVGARWSQIKIGQIRELTPHPNAERLFVVKVDLGQMGVTWRLIAGPLDPPAAEKLCATLKAKGQECVPTPFPH